MFNLSDAFIVSPGLQTELRKEAVVQLIRFRPQMEIGAPLKQPNAKQLFWSKKN
jgi:hypothetical protein